MDAKFENTAALLYSNIVVVLLLTLVVIGGQSISSEWVELGKLEAAHENAQHRQLSCHGRRP
jgi:hypothetical protein